MTTTDGRTTGPSFQPRDYGRCRFTGCRREARLGGLCEPHKQTLRQRTSDGVLTGSNRKLTDEQVAEARRMRSAFKSLREIALHFQVHQETIRHYLRGDHRGGSTS